MDVIFLSEADPKPVIVIFEISILPFRTLRVNDLPFPESDISTVPYAYPFDQKYFHLISPNFISPVTPEY